MTNKLTPQQLLEIARAVEPDIIWQLESSDLIIGVRKTNDGYVPTSAYEPLKPTERGQAQLMRVVLAVLDRGTDLNVCFDSDDELYHCFMWLEGRSESASATGYTKADAILSLAHEVLCNAS